MAKKERKEDLNPRSESIEEKVRQMLDPNLPDKPEPSTPPKSVSIKDLDPIPEIELDTKTEQPPSAPELPSTETVKKPTKKSTIARERKVIMPIGEASLSEEVNVRVNLDKQAKSSKNPVIDDTATDKAVDEIMVAEGDQLLDATAPLLPPATEDDQSEGKKVRRHPALRWFFYFVLLVGLITLSLLTFS